MKPEIKIGLVSFLLAGVPIILGAALTRQNIVQNAQEPSHSANLSILSPTPTPTVTQVPTSSP